MALTEEGGNGFYMPVAPANSGSNGFGFGGDWAWIILLLLLGWGNNGWGNGANAGGVSGLYPWMNQADITNTGFQNALLNDNITEIRSGVTSLASQLCNGVNSIQSAITNSQITDMQTAFAGQTAMAQGFNGLQSQLAQCCCDNRLATNDLKYTIATENCADRAAVSDGIRDLLTAQNANTQRILDQLCNDKIDAKNEKIADLERQLTMANLAASQGAQTSRILADNAAQTAALEQYLAPVPRPAYVVQNPNCCTNLCGTNCGCGVA